jgi:tetratricopeptide (TPR) repeat protein
MFKKYIHGCLGAARGAVPLVFAAGLCAFSCSAAKTSDAVLALYARAQALYADGRFSDAAALLESGARVKKFVPALVLRGKALYFSGNLAGAKAAFNAALKRRPTQTESALYLARIYRELNDDSAARAIVENLVSDDPSNIRALRLAAMIAAEKNGAGEVSEAAYLNRAAAASGETALALLDRARLCWREGRGEDALRDLRGAKGLVVPENPLYKTIESLESIIAQSSSMAGARRDK